MGSIIEVKDLSKSFIISHEGRERYTAMRDVLANNAKKIFSFPSSLRGTKQSASKEEFWALKNVTFSLEQGDRLGVIGRNGAGKSTLLKILSRITEPTTGEIKIRGRVASLLEVGTGFHPELTGRENIFLNGAILGMSRVEIKKKFDEIVNFAEVEQFLDTPVKRYSSGMYVRLAFSVAAHLEPEILIVDEVLAVGDAQFQKKCLGKMEDVSKNEGRTILFVSHNLAALIALTNRAILLKNGCLTFEGLTNSVINTYSLSQSAQNSDFSIKGKYASLNKIELFDENGNLSNTFLSGLPITIKMFFEIHKDEPNISFDIFLKDGIGNKIGFYSSAHFDGINFKRKLSDQIIEITFQMPFLASGSYQMDLFTGITSVCWDQKIERACEFEIINSNPKGGSFDLHQSQSYGAFALKSIPF